MRVWLSGRASASQAEDRGFESRRPLQIVAISLLGITLEVFSPQLIYPGQYVKIITLSIYHKLA